MTASGVLILGANSDIARAVAHVYGAAGYPLMLAGRVPERFAPDMSDLHLRYGVPVTVHGFDVLETDSHAAFVASLPVLPDIVICAVGLLGIQAQAETDADHMSLVLRSNLEGPASALSQFAAAFEDRGSGVLVGISSVAGERGRASNYTYGAAKAGFTAFLSGLRNRLAGKGVHVVTVLPGYVATRMTEGMALPALLTAQPEDVARAIRLAVDTQRNIVHVRPIWAVIMGVIRLIPEPLFKRMKL